ncbi:MAG: GNAT family N-acetyltransferase [Nibricoccus sp.]
MKVHFCVRPVSPEDAEAIAQLTATLGYSAETVTVRNRIHSILTSAENLFIVVVDDAQKPVGWLQAHASEIVESGYRVEIVGLVVAPQYRRLGAGRMLVNEAESWARKKHANAIVVRSNVTRTESHSFYPALGYIAAKTQHVYRKAIE